MGWYTDEALAGAFPSTEGLLPDEVAQAARDGEVVYRFAGENPGVGDDALRKWGESLGIGPDRMNRALTLLRDAGRLFSLLDPTARAPAGAEVRDALSRAFTAPELRKAATRVGADVPKSASKDELAAAVADAAAT